MIDWLGFLGTWLLVAGSMRQGAMALLQEEVDREGFSRAIEKVPPVQVPNRWWCKLPQAVLAPLLRRNRTRRRQIRAVLTAEQYAQLARVREVATGWLIVAAGACLVAVNETWELSEGHDWATWIFVAVLIAASGLSIVSAMVVAGRNAPDQSR